MSTYYTMESVREQIIGKYETRTMAQEEARVPESNWNRYPCKTFKICRAGQCKGYVSIITGIKHTNMILLEICFLKRMERAYIRKNSVQMVKLVELAMVDKSKLCIEIL